MRWLVLAFIVFPFVELYLLLAIGHELGFWPTLGLTILSGVLGSVLARREGLRVISEWRSAVAELRPPEQGVLEGALVIGGAVLLITPGVLSDALGILLLLPPTRRLLVKPIRHLVMRKIERGQLRVVRMGGPGPFAGGPFAGGPFAGGPFAGGPWGNQDPFGSPGPFGNSGASRRPSGDGVVDTTGEAVSDAPRALPR
jgi:UPF0716 protein FxsA